MLVLGVVDLHRTGQLQLFKHQWLGIDLHFRDVEMLALEMNENYSVVFEIAPKYCISDSFTPFFLRDSCPQ